MRTIQRRESELIKGVSVARRFIRSSRGLGAQDVRWTSALRGPEWNGDFSPASKNAPGIYRGTACQFKKNERKDFIYEKFRKRTEAWKKWNRKSVH